MDKYTRDDNGDGTATFYYRQRTGDDEILDTILKDGQVGDIIKYNANSQNDSKTYVIKQDENDNKYAGYPDEADYGGGIKLSKRKSGKRKSGKRKSGKRKSGKRKSGKRKSGKRKSGKRK